MPRHRPRAFTLIELLVAVFIIVVLMSLLLASFKGIVASSNRTASANALRQMGAAYASYANDHRQTLMPGYVDATFDVTAKLRDGTGVTSCSGEWCDRSSYVWRLSPYLDHEWSVMFADYRDRALLDRLETEYDPDSGGGRVLGLATAGPDDLGIAEIPSFGLNSIFLGGDMRHGAAWTIDHNPLDGASAGNTFAAVRVSEVKQPSRQIVFGPAALASTGGITGGPHDGGADPVYASDARYGYPELRPPFICRIPGWVLDNPSSADDPWVGQQWTIGAKGLVERTDDGVYDRTGLPVARWGEDAYPVVNLDGSATIEQLSELSRDMSRWSPRELAPTSNPEGACP